jgi:HEPN domain-containing protein
MAVSTDEWFRQSDYDLDTAKYMFDGGRYSYTVFMCHLAIEKAIKGLYAYKTGKTPPKTHNFIYLLSRLGIKPEKHVAKSITILNEANIATRYPESLEVLQKNYTKSVAANILKQSEEAVKWIKQQL